MFQQSVRFLRCRPPILTLKNSGMRTSRTSIVGHFLHYLPTLRYVDVWFSLGFLALVLSQILCCRLVLGLRNSFGGPVSTIGQPTSASTSYHFARPPPTQTATGFSIPLHEVTMHNKDEEYSNGVKVQVRSLDSLPRADFKINMLIALG